MLTEDPEVDPLTGLPKQKQTTQPVGALAGSFGGSTFDPGNPPPNVPTPKGLGPIPTNPDGSQVGSGIPWLPGATQPSSSPAGFQWDPSSAGYKPSSTPTDPNDPGAMWDAIAGKAGIKDGGAGSGFADRAYWINHPSEILNGRYAADVAGTGTDQPTGTPGSGIWQNSGAADRNKPQASGGGGFWGGAPATDTSSITDSPVIRQLILALMQGTGVGGQS